ncbi:MAG TPA: hypothetical protein DDW50_13240 [Firmicutes bacterium]|jgi:hypothetical protein|nr:hypothetical protein [Bacillota bacterium]
MRIHKLLMQILLICVIGSIFVGNNIFAASQDEPTVRALSDSERKVLRGKLIDNLVEKYKGDQVFNHISEYMIDKSKELHKHPPKKTPDTLIMDTFNKTNSLFEHTKGFIGNSFTTSYAPDNFEKNVNKYLWLKGIGFWVLGIGEEHEMAFSYFYLPGNDQLKEDLLKDIVHYSFPEIPQIEENKLWYDQMAVVMGRLGYRIFNVKEFGLPTVNK